MKGKNILEICKIEDYDKDKIENFTYYYLTVKVMEEPRTSDCSGYICNENFNGKKYSFVYNYRKKLKYHFLKLSVPGIELSTTKYHFYLKYLLGVISPDLFDKRRWKGTSTREITVAFFGADNKTGELYFGTSIYNPNDYVDVNGKKMKINFSKVLGRYYAVKDFQKKHGDLYRNI